MTVADDVAVRVRTLFFREHWKVGTIAAQLSLHHDVIERICNLRSPKRVAPPRTSVSSVAPFAAYIAETLAQYPSLRATRLFDMLRERGYPGSARQLRRYVARHRPKPARPVTVRFETLPGEQAQVDWALVGKRTVDGARRDLWLFVMVLGYSRMLFAEFVWDLSAASLRRSLLRAHQFFQGSVRQWLFDNPRIITLERHGTAVRLHAMLLEVAGELLTEPRVCNVRAPQEKGKVERAVRYLRERFLDGRTIRDPAHGNAEIQDFLSRIAPSRPHPTLSSTTVAQAFEQERERLIALPTPLPSLEQTASVTVDATAFVAFDGNHYSVPASLASRPVTLAFDEETLRVIDGATEVTRHVRRWGRGRRVERPEHRREQLKARPAAAQYGKGRERLQKSVARADELLERWVADQRNLGSLVARTLVLLDGVGATILSESVSEALDRGTTDFGAISALCERRRRPREAAAACDVRFGAHVSDRDVMQHALEGYDER
jgi:transposase